MLKKEVLINWKSWFVGIVFLSMNGILENFIEEMFTYVATLCLYNYLQYLLWMWNPWAFVIITYRYVVSTHVSKFMIVMKFCKLFHCKWELYCLEFYWGFNVALSLGPACGPSLFISFFMKELYASKFVIIMIISPTKISSAMQAVEIVVLLTVYSPVFWDLMSCAHHAVSRLQRMIHVLISH